MISNSTASHVDLPKIFEVGKLYVYTHSRSEEYPTTDTHEYIIIESGDKFVCVDAGPRHGEMAYFMLTEGGSRIHFFKSERKFFSEL